MQPCGEQGEDYPRNQKLGSEKESKLSTLLILASSCGATLMPQEEARISKVEIYTKKEDDIQVQKPADEGSPVKTEGTEPFINHVAGDNKKGNGKWKGKYFTFRKPVKSFG